MGIEGGDDRGRKPAEIYLLNERRPARPEEVKSLQARGTEDADMRTEAALQEADTNAERIIKKCEGEPLFDTERALQRYPTVVAYPMTELQEALLRSEGTAEVSVAYLYVIAIAYRDQRREERASEEEVRKIALATELQTKDCDPDAVLSMQSRFMQIHGLKDLKRAILNFADNEPDIYRRAVALAFLEMKAASDREEEPDRD